MSCRKEKLRLMLPKERKWRNCLCRR